MREISARHRLPCRFRGSGRIKSEHSIPGQFAPARVVVATPIFFGKDKLSSSRATLSTQFWEFLVILLSCYHVAVLKKGNISCKGIVLGSRNPHPKSIKQCTQVTITSASMGVTSMLAQLQAVNFWAGASRSGRKRRKPRQLVISAVSICWRRQALHASSTGRRLGRPTAARRSPRVKCVPR
jgi:hypothetical protein